MREIMLPNTPKETQKVKIRLLVPVSE